MKKSFIYAVLLLFFIQTYALPVLRAEPGTKQKLEHEESAFESLFNRILVYSKDGNRLFGLLAGIKNNSLVVRVDEKDEEIQLNNLKNVVIQKQKNKGLYSITGMILGVYVGNFIFSRAKEQPSVYLRQGSELSYLLINAVFAGVGIKLGEVGSKMLEKGEEVFIFTEDKEKKWQEWERLRRFIIGDTYVTKKVHLNIHSAKVFANVSSHYRDLLDDPYHRYYSYEMRETNHINLMRRMQITYSLSKSFEVGTAMCWLGEPSLSGYKKPEYSYYIRQKLSTTGFYVVGIYKPLAKRLTRNISWKVGLGAGAAKVDFSLKAHNDAYSDIVIEQHNISKLLVSGIGFSELSFSLYDSVSLGLMADYAYIPQQQIPEMTVSALLAQKLSFGNSSIGISFGFHF